MGLPNSKGMSWRMLWIGAVVLGLAAPAAQAQIRLFCPPRPCCPETTPTTPPKEKITEPTLDPITTAALSDGTVSLTSNVGYIYNAIPTSMVITDDQGNTHDSGLVMYPGGHARNDMGTDKTDLRNVLAHKFETLGHLACDEPKAVIKQLSNLEKKSAKDVAKLYDFDIQSTGEKFD